MSERRKCESALTDASFRLDDTLSALREAIYYLQTYTFLQDANPGLLSRIANESRQLQKLRDELLDLDVKS